MDYEHCITKEVKNPHLNYEERKIIERLLKEGVSRQIIADTLCRDLSTIKREIKRGRVITQISTKFLKSPNRPRYKDLPDYVEEKVYHADVGQSNYEKNRQNCGAKNKVVKCSKMVEFVEKKILGPEKWSPDAAIGYVVANNMFEEIFTTKTYYNWVDDGIVKVKNIDLHLKLRRKPKKKRKERKKRLGKCIEERPPEVDLREEFGHWEGDGIVGKDQKGQIITLVERKLGVGMMFNVGDRQSERIVDVFKRLKDKYGNEFGDIFKTATFDNGSEFARSNEMEEIGGMKVYYAHPYSSYERGTNENWNGLVRRFIPKGMIFDDLTEKDMVRISNYINTLPRKRFGYKTPLDLWEEQMYNMVA